MVTHIQNGVSYCSPTGCDPMCDGFACAPPAPPPSSSDGAGDGDLALALGLGLGLGVSLCLLLSTFVACQWRRVRDFKDVQ